MPRDNRCMYIMVRVCFYVYCSDCVARCLESIDICIWRMFVFMSVVVTVLEYVGKFVV